MTDKNEKIRLPKYQYGDEQYKNTHKIDQWPDGTTISYNPESGKESLILKHSSGSYYEFRGTGSVVHFAANNQLMYQKGGLTMSIDNSGDIKISGHGRINVDHDAHIEVAKNASVAVNGMAEIHSKGHVKFSAADILLSSKGSIVLASGRDIELKADKGRILQHSAGANQLTTDSGDFHIEVGGKMKAVVSDNIDIKTSKQMLTESSQDTQIKSSSKITTQSSDSTTFKSDDKIDITASKDIKTQGLSTKIQGGGAVGVPTTFV